MTKFFLPLIVLLSLLACKKSVCDCTPDPGPAPDQIVFGLSHGLCHGNCSLNYRLTSTQVFADECDYCPEGDIPFQTIPLADEKFQVAKLVEDSLPAGLLDLTKVVYGCPDCGDEGGYYLEITRNGEKHIFRWSTNYYEVPDNWRPYFEQVGQTIQNL